MGLFSKKIEICPVCGKEMNAGLFGDSMVVADGIICGACEKMLRGQFDVERHLELDGFVEGGIKEVSEDTLKALTIDDIRRIVNEKKEKQAEATGAYSGEFASILTAEEVFMIAPKPLDVGIKRAKELKERLVVRGLVQAGAFAKGDTVTIVHADSRIQTTLLDVIPCGGAVDFMTELKANMHKKEANINENAWLITDMVKDIQKDDIIGKVN
ncbi:MAG: hypothetical protein J5509_02640 [Lachnospiraceae bacterium]|nr:hypothetical protein [Lachnospiraceae bacterium]